MERSITLTSNEASSAKDIQKAVDDLASGGGCVQLPAGEIILDRGIELYSGVKLQGMGKDTLLKKAPGRVYPLNGYHNYGMLDAPLRTTKGLEPGMTVTLRDNVNRGFHETFARITWIDGEWVGLDTGLESDYSIKDNAVLFTSFPLIFARGAERVEVRSLTLDGSRKEDPMGIGACRGAAVYFIGCNGFEVSGVNGRDFAGEGLGFQMCRNGSIRNCFFSGNAGNGYHPGAGSTHVSFENCDSESNDRSGFFFCVRANHITVRDCRFTSNGENGITVGARDCWNLIERCQIDGNGDSGIMFRESDPPVEAHSCRVINCRVAGNACKKGMAQIEISGVTHDLEIENNEIECGGSRPGAGVFISSGATDIFMSENRFFNCEEEVKGNIKSVAEEPLHIVCGNESVESNHFRHLTKT